MEKVIVELTESQILKDQFSKIVLGAIAGFAADRLTAKLYDRVMTARRIAAAAAQ